MLNKKETHNRFSPYLDDIDPDDPDFLKKAWEDDKFEQWRDAIATYKDPNPEISKNFTKYARTNNNDKASGDEKEQKPNPARLPNDTQQIKLPEEVNGEKSKSLLRQREFDAHDYILQILKDSTIEELHAAEIYFQGGGESEQEIQKKIAENLHNYVKAYDDILKTAEQFQKNCFPGKQDVDDLYERVTSIVNKMNRFFDDIRVQSIKAQNASALYSRISNYSFIFDLASEIDNYRTNSQFEEIARVMQKANNYPYLKDLPLFSEALSNIKKSLRNVEDSLQTKLQQMNFKTFNRSECKLLLDISSQHEANPIIKMLLSINEKVRNKLEEKNFNESCLAMEESLPFWKILCDFYEEYYTTTNENLTEQQINQYKSSQNQINELLLNLIKDFNKESREMLDQIRLNPLPPDVFFNSDLHSAVCRVHAIWSSNIMPFSKATALVNDIMNDLQNWYISFLKDQSNTILNGPEPGNRLSRFLVQMLGDSNLLLKDAYKSIILDPIYDYYDKIHEDALVNDNVDLVSAVITLNQLSRKNMDQIFQQFQTNGESNYSKFISERDYDTVHVVGDELSKLLRGKLIRKITIEFNSAIYNGMFMKNIDWNSRNLQIRPDGWIVFILNRCIQYKCDWGELYDDLSSQIIQSIVGSLLNAIFSINSLSQQGRARLELDIKILREIFGSDPESDSSWRCIDDRLQFLCMTLPREIRSEIIKTKSGFLSEIRLQVYALNPEYEYAENQSSKGKESTPPVPTSTYALYNSNVASKSDDEESYEDEEQDTKQDIVAPAKINASSFATVIKTAGNRRPPSRVSHSLYPTQPTRTTEPAQSPSTFRRVSAPEPQAKPAEERSEKSEISSKDETGEKKKKRKKRRPRRSAADEEEEKSESKSNTKERDAQVKVEKASSDSEPEKEEKKEEKSERSEKEEKSEKSEKSERSEKEEKSEKSEKSEKEEKSEKSEKSDKEEKPEKSEKSDKEEEKSEKSEKSEKEEVIQKEENTEKEPEKEKKKKDKKKKKKEDQDETKNENEEKSEKKKEKKSKRKSSTVENEAAAATATAAVAPPPAEEKKDEEKAEEPADGEKKKKKKSKKKSEAKEDEKADGNDEAAEGEKKKKKKSKKKSEAKDEGEEKKDEEKPEEPANDEKAEEPAEGEKKKKKKSKKKTEAKDEGEEKKDEEKAEEPADGEKKKKKKSKKKTEAKDEEKADGNDEAAEGEKKKKKKKSKTDDAGDEEKKEKKKKKKSQDEE